MPKNKQILMISIVLTIATLTVFWQVNHDDFINVDDNIYITENNHVQNGITLDGIRWAFTSGHDANWFPLTWLSHMLDVQLFGLNPRWHHLTNLLFHIANTLLLFLVLYRMTKARWESAFVAALFALHPLHVESVAWAAERKDVLAAFFWILTMGAYCYYVEHQRLKRYLLVVLFFVLGLMSKPMLVTLPFVLLLLDYWPLQRLQQKISDQTIRTAKNKPISGDKQKGKLKKKHTSAGEEVKVEMPAGSRYQWALIRPLLWEKTPLFALTALSSIVTYSVQQKGGAVSSFETIPLSLRIENAIVSYVTYIGKTIWPNDLAVLYPYPLSLPAWQVFGAVLIFIGVTLMVIWATKRFRYLATGWFWYAGTLVPVIGLVQVGLQARADRYTYIPLIGLLIMAAWGIPDLLRKWRYRKETLFTLSALSLACCIIVTWIQVGYWRDSIMLFEHTLNVTDNNYIAYNNRGTAYYGLGSYTLAKGDFDRAIEINQKYLNSYINRGNAYDSLGNHIQAIKDYDKAIELNPNHIGAYYNRGIAYYNLGNDVQAIKDYEKVIELDPKFAKAYNNRAVSFSRLGNQQQAYEDMKAAAVLGDKAAQNILRRQGLNW